MTWVSFLFPAAVKTITNCPALEAELSISKYISETSDRFGGCKYCVCGSSGELKDETVCCELTYFVSSSMSDYLTA